jgi:hypothetical protein
MQNVNDCCVVEREMQDARKASHVIRGAKNYDSPQTVLCNVTQLFARSKSVTVFDATHSKRVAQNIKLTKRGQMRRSDCRFSF